MGRAAQLVLLLAAAAATLVPAARAGSLMLSDRVLTENGQLITVAWADIPVVGNVSNPDNQMYADQIVLVQSDAPWKDRWPIKYIWVSQTAKDSFLEGRGFATFWVINHRQPLEFLYLRYPSVEVGIGQDFAWGNAQVLAGATLDIHPGLAKAPHQLRLSLLGFHLDIPGDGHDYGKAKLDSSTASDDDDGDNQAAYGYYKSQAEHRSYPSPRSEYEYDEGSKAHDTPSYYKQRGDNDDERHPGPSYGRDEPYASKSPSPHHPNGRSVQISWQSTLPGGVAIAGRSREEVESCVEAALKEARGRPYAAGTAYEDPYASESLHVAEADAETYRPQDMCGFPANSTGWLDPGFTNFAIWRGLQHNQRYFYAVGSPASGFSSIRSFKTPPLAVSDCYKGAYYGQPCDGHSCSKDCLELVDSVKLLLAADIGTNNHKDGTWSADGQGFYTLNSVQSTNLNNTPGVPGPVWPGRNLPFVYENKTYYIPYSTLFYSLYAVADFPAWGQQPATYYVAQAMNAAANSGNFHSAFVVGDLAYAEGMSAHWDMFLTDFEPTFSTLPTMFSNGNHESSDDKLPEVGLPPDPESAVPDSGGECGIVYERRMRMPTPASIPPSKRPEYYSYTIGPIAVVVLSTEQKFDEGSLQYNWLVGELDKFAWLRARGKFPWLVVAFHRPMYVDDPDISAGLGNQWVASFLLEQLEPLFARYQVDMTWTGHTHFYHRSCPVFKRNCQAQPVPAKDGHLIYAPVHVMVGNGGFQPGASVFNETPPWMAAEKFSYGYCTIEASQTNLNMECFDAVTGAKFDETALSKPAGWRPCPEEAAQNYASVALVPNPLGINVTAELGPAASWLLNNLGPLKAWALNNTQVLAGLAFLGEKFFGPDTDLANLMAAVPGSELYSMDQVSPIYYAVTYILKLVDLFLPPELKNPAADEIAYIAAVNSPPDPQNNVQPGRLWLMLNGTVPFRAVKPRVK